MDEVAEVRAFNRFWTSRIAALAQGHLRTPHPLPEARVLYELGAHQERAVGELKAAMGIDAGYLSRLLSRMEANGLVAREPHLFDARRQVVRLTAEGREAFRLLDERSAAEN